MNIIKYEESVFKPWHKRKNHHWVKATASIECEILKVLKK